MPLTYEFIPLIHRTRLSPGHRLIVATGADCQRCPRFGVSVIYPVWTLDVRAVINRRNQTLTFHRRGLRYYRVPATQAPRPDRATQARQERPAPRWHTTRCRSTREGPTHQRTPRDPRSVQ